MALTWEASPGPAYENFTLYTEIDPSNHIDIVDNGERLDVNSISENEDAYIYYDYLSSLFGDFEHYLDVQATDHVAKSSTAMMYAISNTTDDFNNNLDYLGVKINWRQGDGQWRLQLEEMDGGVLDPDFMQPIDEDKWYYLILNRTGTSFTCEIYNESARTTLLDTLSLTVTTENFRYLFGCASVNKAQADPLSFEVAQLMIGAVVCCQFSTDGYYYTDQVIANISGRTLALLYNYSSNTGTVTVESSSDNITFVNHNGVAGSDTLVDGYECLDLRDLNFTTIYMRFNYTRGAMTQTPLIRQIRVITDGDAPTATATVNVYPFIAIALILVLSATLIFRR
jgi:hypothetical protein